jgi:hypothetical protein
MSLLIRVTRNFLTLPTGKLSMNHKLTSYPVVKAPHLLIWMMIAAAAAFLPVQGRSAERQFLSGYVGTLPPAKEDRARTYFDRPEVRSLLAALESRPIAKAQAVNLLRGMPTQLQDLLRLHLVREDRGVVRIAFPYFTASDMNLIHAVAAQYVPGLVAAYKAHQSAFDGILKLYPVADVDRKRLAFVLIAGFSLNWDALDLLRERGYRGIAPIRGDGWQYGFWASEDVPDYSYSGFYWGSSTFPADALNLTPPLDITFSSFGDALSEPRMNLPDLLALPPDQMTPPVRQAAEKLGLRDDNELDMNLKNVVGLFRARDFGALLFAMRHGATATEQICAALSSKNGPDCAAELGLLLATGYVNGNREGKYELSVPVFDTNDKPMLDAALTLSRGLIVHWLVVNYSGIRNSLSKLTAARQGVSYQVMFTQIWHELFGLATRELAAQGIIENPRDARVIWQGSIPMVWRTALYRHKFE